MTSSGQDDDTRMGSGVEVRVSRSGKSLARVLIAEWPATIGRGNECDVQLDSKHVSRVHAKLYSDNRGLHLVDNGSTNGFAVNGRKEKSARIDPADLVTICGFDLRIQEVGGATPTHEVNSDSWADAKRGDGHRTEIRDAKTDHENQPREAVPQAMEASASVVNRLMHEQQWSNADSQYVRGPQSEDEEEDRELVLPDLPPLLVTLHKEANSLLGGAAGVEFAVEVIRTIGDRVFDVALLLPGDAYWWGGKPGMIGSLVIAPSARRFPMATHVRSGRFRVDIPQDTRWQMFHRGRNPVDVHRSGHLVGCRGEVGDQIEVTFGPFSHYIRCVRAPRKLRWRYPWHTLQPSRWLSMAMVASVLFHAAVLAMPSRPLPRLKWRAVEEIPFAEVRLDIPETERPAQEVPPPLAESLVPAPSDIPESEEPEIEAEPEPVVVAPKPRRRPNKILTAPAPEKTPVNEESPPANQGMKRVSVGDFKVYGLMGHVPTVDFDVGASPDMRASRNSLRGGGNLKNGLVLKRTRRMRVRPPGRLSREAVARVANANARDISRCYNKALNADPAAQGELQLQWIVDLQGTAAGVKIIYDEVHSNVLVRCLRTAIHRWKFPRPEGGPAEVTYPFTFANPRL